MSQPATYIKAILAAAIAGVGSLTTAAADGGVTLAEGLAALGATLVALGAVYQIPNAEG